MKLLWWLIKQWGLAVLGVALLVFLGWQAATLLEHRGERQPAAPEKSTQAGPFKPQKIAVTPRSRRPLQVLRSIDQPEKVEISVANIANNPLFSDFVDSSSKTPTHDVGPVIRLVTGFEGSPAAKLTKVSDTYWVIEDKDPVWERPHFFLFRVEGAAGRSVTFEIRNVPLKWATINPVYSYAASLDDLVAFTSAPVDASRLHKAPNGPQLPNTNGQGWQFIEDAKLLNGSFWFSQRFDRDAYVCMRYPYTPGYNQRYLDSLTNNPAAKVITVGASKEGRPLRVVKIGDGTEADEKRKPCVLIFAREHADEQDSSWAAQGAIDFLISDAPEARQIREKFTFLVIPLLDPDGAVIGVYEHIIGSFTAGAETPESTAYSAFFKGWVDKGNPLQLVLNLHNLESREGPHLSLLTVEPEKERRGCNQMFFDSFVQPLAGAEKFLVKKQTRLGISGRLGNWLSDSFGTLRTAFELNVQEPTRHLTLSDLHQIGKVLVLASSRYLLSQEAGPLMTSIDKLRQERLARWNKYGDSVVAKNAFDAETKCKWRADSDSAKWEAWQAERLREFH